MKTFVDTILYTPSIEVIQVDKEKGLVNVIDLINKKERILKLQQSKQNSHEYYFRMNNTSYWLHLLFQIEK